MEQQQEPIIVIETKGARTTDATYYKNEDAFVSAIAAWASRGDASIEFMCDAIQYIEERRACNVEVITKEDFLKTEGWDTQVMNLAKKYDWFEDDVIDEETE